MSHTPKPKTATPVCPECETETIWDSKWADWYCFQCGKSIEKELM